MTEKEIKCRLERMAMAGHCPIVIGGAVSLPEEVEDYFNVEEQKELLAYVKART